MCSYHFFCKIRYTKNAKVFLSKYQTAAPFDRRLQTFVDEYYAYKQDKKKSLRILDIGCGKKVYLFKYKKKDDIFYGCDFFPSIDVRIDQYKQIDLNEENLQKKFPNVKFDIVFCGEVLEHVFSPDDLLKEIRKMMHKESILVLSTPNLGYYVNRVLLLFGIFPLFLENSSEEKLGRKFSFLGQGNETQGHIRVFTYGALRELFDKEEFQVIKVIPFSIFHLWIDTIFQKISPSFSSNNIFILKKKK